MQRRQASCKCDRHHAFFSREETTLLDTRYIWLKSPFWTMLERSSARWWYFRRVEVERGGAISMAVDFFTKCVESEPPQVDLE